MTPSPNKSPWLAHPPLETVYVDASVRDGEIARNVKEALGRIPEYAATRWIEVDDYQLLPP